MLRQTDGFNRIQPVVIHFVQNLLVGILTVIPGPLLNGRHLRWFCPGRRGRRLKTFCDFSKIILKSAAAPEARQGMIPKEKDNRINVDVFETGSKQQSKVDTRAPSALDDL